MRIALTQSEGRLEGLEQALMKRGHEVVRSPLIETRPLLSNEVRDKARELLECPWVLFTSPAGVEAWHALNMPFRGTNIRVGVVGEKTGDIVKKYGGKVRLIGNPSTAKGLAETFLETRKAPKSDGAIGLPQGNRALPTLQDALEANGYQTHPVVIYETLMLDWQADEVEVVVLSSPSAVEALPQEVGQQAKLVALGPSTGAAIAEYGWPYTQAKRSDADAVLAAIERLA